MRDLNKLCHAAGDHVDAAVALEEAIVKKKRKKNKAPVNQP